MTARCHPACLDPACPACARAAAPADSKVAAAGCSLTVWRGVDGPEAFPAELPASARAALALALAPEIDASLTRLRSAIAAVRATIAAIPPDERYPARHLLDRVMADLDGAEGK